MAEASSASKSLKRPHEGDEHMQPQSKVFVDDKKVNSSNDTTMSQIYEKTMGYLYDGSKKCFSVNNNNESERPEQRKCVLCKQLATIFQNCPCCVQSSCFMCTEFCPKCNRTVCSNCFGNFLNDIPSCDICNLYI